MRRRLGRLQFRLKRSWAYLPFGGSELFGLDLGHPVVSLMMLIIHPVWFLGVGSGDCGMGLEMLSFVMLGFSVGLAIWQYEKMKRAESKKS